jgi:hypothetical protein
MVIFGGLEIAAAGYLIHRHNQNKREKARLDDEAAALEEQQYRLFPADGHGRPHRRHRSHSHSRTRRSHSRDGRKHEYERRPRSHSYERKSRRDTSLPPVMPMPMSVPMQQNIPPPQYTNAPPGAMPAPYPQSYPQDVKYGWTDEPAPASAFAGTAAPQEQQPAAGVVTGWPAHWTQSQTPEPNMSRPPSGYPAGQAYQGESPRVRPQDAPASPHVRLAVPGERNLTTPGGRRSRSRERTRPRRRSESYSPPPSYRA